MEKKFNSTYQQLRSLPLLPGRILRFFTDLVRRDDGRYTYEMAIVAIVKNEEDYLAEWIEYHKLVGVSKFIMFDNGSTDSTADILKQYAENGDVIYTYYPGNVRQMEAYNEAIAKYRNDFHYMAFIDADEFIYPFNHEKKIPEIVNDILSVDKNAAGLAVNWRMFGSSHLEHKPEKGGVIDNFLYRAKEDGKGNDCIKTIANPRYIYKYNHPHYPIYNLGKHAVNESGTVTRNWCSIVEELQHIRINHYFTKSKDEWVKRRSMGRGAAKKDPTKYKRSIEEFYEHDNNDVYDDGMLYFAEKIKL